MDVPTHWTYTDCERGDDLFQGDIIAREPLLGVLSDVHKHFCASKYLAFIVLTQTCDLVVRKKSSCKAKHISLAVIRPLSSLMSSLLQEMCNSPRSGVFSKDRREDAEQFLHRVLNQNEQAHGWVYLHPDGDVGIGEPAVAMLRVGISLRSNEHYELIRNARCGRLDTEFRNKLGWLKGNLYSRIDTTDWAERDSGDAEEKAIIKDLLDAPIGGRPPLWVPTVWIAQAIRNKVSLEDCSVDQIDRILRDNAPMPPLELALTEVKKTVDRMSTDFTERPAEAFKTRIAKDPCLLPLVAHAITIEIGALIEGWHWQFCELVASDSELLGHITDGFQRLVMKFVTRQGPKHVSLFVDTLVVERLLTDEAVERVIMLCEHRLETGSSDCKQIIPLLQAIAVPPSLIEHIRTVAICSIQESLADRIAAKLTNSQTFTKALKPE